MGEGCQQEEETTNKKGGELRKRGKGETKTKKKKTTKTGGEKVPERSDDMSTRGAGFCLKRCLSGKRRAISGRRRFTDKGKP